MAYRNHPDLMSGFGGPIGAEAAVLLLQAQSGRDPNLAEGWVMFGIEDLRSGRVVGEVGIFLPAGAECGDLGWTVHPDYQRQGLATEAARVLLAWAFERRALHRVTAGCEQRNTASWRLMERLGMRREGVHRQSRLAMDGWQDEFAYALLATGVAGGCWRAGRGWAIERHPIRPVLARGGDA